MRSVNLEGGVVMGMERNPKKLAEDVADGFFSLSEGALRRYSQPELRTIKVNLEVVARDIRAQRAGHGEHADIQVINLKLSRVSRTLITMANFAKRHKLIL